MKIVINCLNPNVLRDELLRLEDLFIHVEIEADEQDTEKERREAVNRVINREPLPPIIIDNTDKPIGE